jgi:hypothetical protein
VVDEVGGVEMADTGALDLVHARVLKIFIFAFELVSDVECLTLGKVEVDGRDDCGAKIGRYIGFLGGEMFVNEASDDLASLLSSWSLSTLLSHDFDIISVQRLPFGKTCERQVVGV